VRKGLSRPGAPASDAQNLKRGSRGRPGLRGAVVMLGPSEGGQGAAWVTGVLTEGAPRSADPSGVAAEDQGVGGVRDQTDRTPISPCWVRNRPVNHGQQRAAADARRSVNPQVVPPTAP